MSIEMKITGANPREIAQQITAFYGLFALPKVYSGPAPSTADLGPGAIMGVVAEPAIVGAGTDNRAEAVVEPPKPRGRPKKQAAEPAPEPKAEAPAPEPEKQIDLEEAIAVVEKQPEPPKEIDEETLRKAILALGNAARVKSAPDVPEAMKLAVGTTYKDFEAAGVARGEPKLAEYKAVAIPQPRRQEFIDLFVARTATLNGMADGAWKGAF